MYLILDGLLECQLPLAPFELVYSFLHRHYPYNQLARCFSYHRVLSIIIRYCRSCLKRFVDTSQLTRPSMSWHAERRQQAQVRHLDQWKSYLEYFDMVGWKAINSVPSIATIRGLLKLVALQPFSSRRFNTAIHIKLLSRLVFILQWFTEPLYILFGKYS